MAHLASQPLDVLLAKTHEKAELKQDHDVASLFDPVLDE